jgi:aarF domain-containing kinase
MDDREISKLRNAVMEREGLILSIFELLRVIPRRLLMILKLSDLQRRVQAEVMECRLNDRSLDFSLATTHGQSRIFLIVARYCAKAGTFQMIINVYTC